MTTTSKTSKSAKTPAAATPFEAWSMPAPTFEFPNAFREFAEKSVSQAREAYARMKSAAEDATDLVEGTIETAREGAFAIGVKALDAAKSNSDASFAHARELLGAKTMAEVIELQSSFAHSQLEAVVAQVKELQEMSGKLFAETTKPVTETVEKTFKQVRVA